LALGIWPKHDPWGHPIAQHNRKYCRGGTPGSPLADGWCAQLWILKGDLEWRDQSLWLPRPSCLSPRCCCRADASDLLAWANFQATIAGWRATMDCCFLVRFSSLLCTLNVSSFRVCPSFEVPSVLICVHSHMSLPMLQVTTL
jgi:hypothetical protein